MILAQSDPFTTADAITLGIASVGAFAGIASLGITVSQFWLSGPRLRVEITEIQPWLLELVDLCDETLSQAVVCSHHPELIDYLGSDRGVLLARESSTATEARSIKTPAADTGLTLSETLARGWYA